LLIIGNTKSEIKAKETCKSRPRKERIDELFESTSLVRDSIPDYSQVQETARTLQQKKRLEERLNELNAETDK